uniref:Putative receptor-like protein kinase At4g00960 n=1 Tax=Rhizophora mucronata TaxID=61149 RepID=A0A2P2LPL1_RHIMU
MRMVMERKIMRKGGVIKSWKFLILTLYMLLPRISPSPTNLVKVALVQSTRVSFQMDKRLL